MTSLDEEAGEAPAVGDPYVLGSGNRELHDEQEVIDRNNAKAFWSRSLTYAANACKGTNGQAPFIPEYGLFMHRDKRPRCWAASVVTWKLFEPIIILVILLNCATLAARTDAPGFDETDLGKRLAVSELVFLAIFTVEMILKMLAVGLIWHPGSYFKSGWNYIDFIIVVTGFLSLGPAGNYSAVRAARVLRPLRTLYLVNGLRNLVNALIKALPLLLDVIYLSCFFFAVFGVISVQLYMGKFKHRCAPPDFASAYTDGEGLLQNVSFFDPEVTEGHNANGICTGPNLDDVTFTNQSSLYVASGIDNPNAGHVCPWEKNLDPAFPNGTYCVKWENPADFHYRHFDNILVAWLCIFQHVTFCDYIFIMYDGQDAISWWMWPFHVTIAVFGAFFLMNLMVAVLYLHFSRTQGKRELAKKMELLGVVDLNTQDPMGAHTGRTMGAPRTPQHPGPYGCTQDPMGAHTGRTMGAPRTPQHPGPLNTQDPMGAHTGRTMGAPRTPQHPGPYGCTQDPMGAHTGSTMGAPRTPQHPGPYGCTQDPMGAHTGQLDRQHPSKVRPVQLRGLHRICCQGLEPKQLEPQRLALTFRRGVSSGAKVWENFQGGFKRLATNNWFKRVSVLNITLNAVLLGIYWFEMSAVLKEVFQYINAGLVSYFGIELIVNLVAFGPWTYLTQYSLAFDAIVIVASIVDMVINLVPGHSTLFNGSLSCLRLQALLLNSADWGGPSHIIRVLLSALASVGYLNLLILLFMFITGLIGMQVFGYSLQSCEFVEGSQQLCPPGLAYAQCPSHLDCYVGCAEDQANTWYDVDGSPYGGMAYCEEFPRPGTEISDQTYNGQTEFWAQVGKPEVERSNYDNIYNAIISIFGLLTLDNWADRMHYSMYVVSPASAIFFVIVIVLGNLILLALFLAILLSSLDDIEDLEHKLEEEELEANNLMACPSLPVFATPEVTVTMDAEDRDDHNEQDDIEAACDAATHTTVGAHPYRYQVGSLQDSALPGASGRLSHSRASPSVCSRTLTQSQTLHQKTELLHKRKRKALHQVGVVKEAVQRGYSHNTIRESSHNNAGEHSMGCNYKPSSPMSRGYSVLSVGRNQSGSLPAGTVNTRRSHEYAVQGHEVRNSMGCNYKPSSPMSRGRSVPSVGLHQSGYLPAGPSNSRRSQEYAVQGEAVQNSMGSGMPGTQVVQQHGQQHASHSSGTIAQAATCQQLQQYNSMGRGMPATQAVLPFWQRIYQRCVLTFDYHKERAINQSEGASFYIFEPENPIRYLLVMIFSSRIFHWGMLCIDILSCIGLTMDVPWLDSSTARYQALNIINILTVTIFIFEAALKMVAQGVITNGKGSYFRVGWNLLDFFVSILGLVVLIGNKIFSESRPTWCIILRGFQGLRIIRASIKVAGIRIIISTFSLVLLEMGGALLVGFVVYYIFGVLATHMFSGKLYYCAVDSNVLLQAYYVVPEGEYINKSWCNQNNSVILVDSSYYHSVINVSVPPHLIYTDWTVPKTRFDNTYLSMWTLFQMASTEGWVDVMLSMVDAVGVDEQPIPNHHPSIEIFSVVFIIVGSFIILGLIASVVINKFKQLKRDGSNIFLTDEQQEWLAIQKMLVAAKIKEHDVPPQNKFRRWMYDLTQATWFQWVIMGVIILSIISMCMEYEGASDEYNNGLRVFNTIATAIYVLEVVCKWIALGLRGYFRNRWNVFDFFVAIISVVGITIEYIDVENLGILYLIRATRVIRILSLVPKARGLSMLVQSILWVMPAAVNMAAVLLMFMFIYAIAGMNWFGNIQPGVSHLENIDRHANFNDFPTTMLLLFRFITGENWGYVMHDAMNEDYCIKVVVPTRVDVDGETIHIPQGIYLDSGDNATLIEHIPGDNLDNQCSLSPALAVIYFCTYMLWVTFMVVQLVIGIVLEEVQANSFLEDLFIREDHVTAFKDCWAVSDPMGSGFIPICKLGTLLKELEPPFGVKDMEHINLETQSMIDATYIPNRNNRVHFIEVLHALASINAGVDMPFEAEMAVSQGLIRRLPEEDLPPPGRTASQYYASITLAAAMRGFLLRTQKGRFSSLKDAIVEEQRAEGEAVRREKARLDGKRVRSMPGSFGLSRAGASPRSINNLIHAESAANGSFHQARENGTPRRCLRPWSQSTQERRPPSERQFFTDSVTTRGSL